MTIILIMWIIGYIYSTTFYQHNYNTLNCGLLGYCGKKAPNPLAIKMMMKHNESRGSHSTGVAVMQNHKSKTVDTFKTKDKGSLFLKKKETQKYFNASVIIGHTRYATMGETSAENAHPYSFPGIVGTHNGWLLDKSKLGYKDEIHSFESVIERNEYNKDELPVDSMLIFKHISEKKDVKAVEEIEGAMALAFIKGGDLYLYRRESKPLFIKTGDGYVMYSSLVAPFEDIFGEDHGAKMMESDKFFVYRRGELIDTIDVKKPKIDIKLDASPSGFYFSSTYTPKKTEIKFHKKDEKGNYFDDYLNKMAFSRPIDSIEFNNKSCLNIFNHEINNDKRLMCLDYTWNEAYIKKITSSSKKKSVSKSQESIIVLSIEDEHDNSTNFTGWRACINGYNQISSFGKNNRLALKIPYHLSSEKEISVLIHPPNGYGKSSDEHGMVYSHKYYKLSINTMPIKDNAQVLEVTCTIPFRRDFIELKDKSKSPFKTLLIPELEETSYSPDAKYKETIFSSKDLEIEKEDGQIQSIFYADDEFRNSSNLESPPNPNNLSLSDNDKLNLFSKNCLSLYMNLDSVISISKISPTNLDRHTVESCIDEINSFLVSIDNEHVLKHYHQKLKGLICKYISFEKLIYSQFRETNMSSQANISDRTNKERRGQLALFTTFRDTLEETITDVEYICEEARKISLELNYATHDFYS